MLHPRYSLVLIGVCQGCVRGVSGVCERCVRGVLEVL